MFQVQEDHVFISVLVYGKVESWLTKPHRSVLSAMGLIKRTELVLRCSSAASSATLAAAFHLSRGENVTHN